MVVRSWTVGDRTCTLSVPRPSPSTALHAVIEWAPAPPSRLSGPEWVQYRQGRDAALAEVAHALQLTVAVVEL